MSLIDSIAHYTASTPALQELQQKMLQYENKVAPLRKQWNQLVPINQLPDEILSEIFYQFVLSRFNEELVSSAQLTDEDVLSESSTPYFLVGPLQMICNRWTVVVLNSPRLWSTILPFKSALLAEILRRSKSSLLSLNITLKVLSRTDEVDSCFRLMLEALSRAHTAYLGSSTELYQLASVMLPISAPNLHSLTYIGAHIQLQDEAVSHFFATLQIPTLRTLRILKASLSNVVPLFVASLTSLHIYDHLIGLEIDSLLLLLQRLPSLQRLSIQSYDPGPLFPGESERKVHFPHLDVLHMCCQSLDCRDLLSHFIFPPSTAIDITFTSYLQEDFEVLGEIPWILNDIDYVTKSSPIQSVALLRSQRCYVLEFWRMHRSVDAFEDTELLPDLRICVYHSAEIGELRKVLEPFSLNSPLLDIRSLFLKTFDESSYQVPLHEPQLWRSITEAFPAIEELLVSGDGESDCTLCYTLSPSCTFDDLLTDSPLSAPLILPNLRALTLRSVRFAYDLRENAKYLAAPYLVSALEKRIARNSPLKLLRIQEPVGLLDEELDLIRPLVVILELDSKDSLA